MEPIKKRPEFNGAIKANASHGLAQRRHAFATSWACTGLARTRGGALQSRALFDDGRCPAVCSLLEHTAAMLAAMLNVERYLQQGYATSAVMQVPGAQLGASYLFVSCNQHVGDRARLDNWGYPLEVYTELI